MPISRRSLIATTFVLALLATMGAPASAQQWPTKPVKIVVPFAPGGGSDFIGRYIARRLTESLGQPFIVENKPGAGGNIGTEQGIRAAPDGYTFTLIASSYTVNAIVYKLSFDPVNDITPIIQLSQGPLIVVVNPGVPAKDLKELIALAKASPGTINFASAGAGTITHAAAALFNLRAGISMTHIPYKGTSPALTDTLSGQTQVLFSSPSTALPHIQAGKLRALAVTTPKRVAVLPNVPTVGEAGVANYEVTLWHGLIAPKGVSPEIVEKLNATITKALRLPETEEQLKNDGVSPAGGTPAQFAATIKNEIEVWRKAVPEANIRVE